MDDFNPFDPNNKYGLDLGEGPDYTYIEQRIFQSMGIPLHVRATHPSPIVSVDQLTEAERLVKTGAALEDRLDVAWGPGGPRFRRSRLHPHASWRGGVMLYLSVGATLDEGHVLWDRYVGMSPIDAWEAEQTRLAEEADAVLAGDLSTVYIGPGRRVGKSAGFGLPYGTRERQGGNHVVQRSSLAAPALQNIPASSSKSWVLLQLIREMFQARVMGQPSP